MCDPGTMLAIASTGANLLGQIQEGRTQEEFQRQATQLNNDQADLSQAALVDQQSESRESTARETFRANREALRVKASAVTAAGEAGVSGVSVDSLIRDFDVQEGFLVESLRRRDELTISSIENNKAGIEASTNLSNFRINQPIKEPDFIGATLGIGTTLEERKQRKKKESQARN